MKWDASTSQIDNGSDRGYLLTERDLNEIKVINDFFYQGEIRTRGCNLSALHSRNEKLGGPKGM